MNSNYVSYGYPVVNENGDRFFGGFLGPFILGGITGGLLTPTFNNRPNGYGYVNNYYYPPYYYQPYPGYYY